MSKPLAFPLPQQESPEQVEYTISQDQAAGHHAQEESGYRLLSGREFDQPNLLTSKAPSAKPPLQDYQIELMLLEQQNKKRLMMARQSGLVMETSRADFKEFASPQVSRKRGQEEVEDDREPREGSEGEPGDNHERGGNEERTNECEEVDGVQSYKPVDPAPLSQSKRQKASHAASRGHQPTENPRNHHASAEQSEGCSSKRTSTSSSTASLEQEPNEKLQDGGASNTNLDEQGLEVYGYRVLYRVLCSGFHAQCHHRVYLDEPRRIPIQGVYHLSGDTLVSDLADFLQSHEKTAFIVYRDFRCEEGTRSSLLGYGTGRRTAKYFRELISIVSEELHSILQQRSKFAPNEEAYKIDSYESSSYRTSAALSNATSEYSHRFLYNHRLEISAEAATAPEGSAINALSSYILDNPDSMYKKCDDLFTQGLVSHDTLPWLFRPNGIVVSSQGPLPIAYILRCFPAERSQLKLQCWNWGYDGHKLRRKDTTLIVNPPAFGEGRIDALAVYPVEYATTETRNRLLDNGTKFWSLRQQALVSYEGPDYKGERIYSSDSRFMVDYQVYSKFHGDSEAFKFSAKPQVPYDQWPDAIPNTATLTEAHKMLLPPGIHGFFLKEKKWMHLLIHQIRPVSWNKVAFDRLVLPKRTKSLIKALVMVRKQTEGNPAVQIGLKGKRDDIIAGKGSGLIMLLHGGPGTGKTLTAESVAELAEMPLYSVTCGDIGTKPEAVEMYLNSVLYLGKTWNCVLLLDEADVFLEERSLSDLDRNSLVSVFLRTLEYYDGVLILTSNRVGTFDEAFKSRIQLALHYPPLNVPGRRKIWHNFLNMLRDDNEKVEFDDIAAHMDELSGYEINGRQIRNALTTARQLALFEREPLDWERIKDSIEVASDFNRYIKEVHGDTDEQWSRDNNLR